MFQPSAMKQASFLTGMAHVHGCKQVASAEASEHANGARVHLLHDQLDEAAAEADANQLVRVESIANLLGQRGNASWCVVLAIGAGN